MILAPEAVVVAEISVRTPDTEPGTQFPPGPVRGVGLVTIRAPSVKPPQDPGAKHAEPCQ
jgi:hypothetical protein